MTDITATARTTDNNDSTWMSTATLIDSNDKQQRQHINVNSNIGRQQQQKITTTDDNRHQQRNIAVSSSNDN